MKAAEFKAKCLKVMDEIAATGEELTVTKRGKPIARILPPVVVLPETPYWGWGAGAAFHVPNDADLIAPIIDPDDWDYDESNLLPKERTAAPDSPADDRVS